MEQKSKDADLNVCQIKKEQKILLLLVPLRFSDLTDIAQLFTSSDHRL